MCHLMNFTMTLTRDFRGGSQYLYTPGNSDYYFLRGIVGSAINIFLLVKFNFLFMMCVESYAINNSYSI